MPTDVADIVFAIGRILLGAIFVRAGIHHFFIMIHLPAWLPNVACRGRVWW